MRTLMFAFVGLVATIAGLLPVYFLYRAWRLLETTTGIDSVAAAIQSYGTIVGAVLICLCVLLMCIVWAILLVVADRDTT
jgi:hypothetical protein